MTLQLIEGKRNIIAKKPKENAFYFRVSTIFVSFHFRGAP